MTRTYLSSHYLTSFSNAAIACGSHKDKCLKQIIADFLHEEIDSYNWNYLDQHICGDTEFDELIEVI